MIRIITIIAYNFFLLIIKINRSILQPNSLKINYIYIQETEKRANNQ